MKKLCILLALTLLMSCVSFVPGAFAKESTYAQTLFDQSKPITINIIMEQEAWDHMIATASDEEYSACDMEVNGVLYQNVAIRPKGNSSLASVTSLGSERYSWRVKFDKYEKKRTCDGLDVLILNNGFKDPGQLREALAYDMYAFLEADASLYNYAIVYVNGEYFGCYLALEGVDESFAERNYGHDDGNLYKPEISGQAKKNKANDADEDGQAADDSGNSFGGSFGGQATQQTEGTENTLPAAPEQGDAQAERPEASEDGQSSGSRGGQATEGDGTAASSGASSGESAGQAADGTGDSSGRQAPSTSNDDREGASSGQGFTFNFGGGGGTQSAMALNYVGDDLESYQGIWDSAKFKSDEEDYARVVEALKHVCQGDSITDYIDTDNLLKYFAIQTFIYNHDGLTGTVTHNYYLYEEDGKVNLIPWDMNESFTVSGNGSDYVNFPIDTPFTVSDLSQRSFFMALLADEECLAKYHEYLRQLSEEYALGGALEETIARIRGMIDTYMESDPTKFCSYDEYEAAARSLLAAIQLRAQSVLGQLTGEIPSTRDGQSAEPEKLLDTSDADLSGLISGVGMGFNMGRMPGMR